jgi:hypothetical protein
VAIEAVEDPSAPAASAVVAEAPDATATESPVKPAGEDAVETAEEDAVETAGEDRVKPATDSVVNQAADSAVKPAADSAVKPAAESAMKPAADSAVKRPPAQGAVKPARERLAFLPPASEPEVFVAVLRPSTRLLSRFFAQWRFKSTGLGERYRSARQTPAPASTTSVETLADTDTADFFSRSLAERAALRRQLEARQEIVLLSKARIKQFRRECRIRREVIATRLSP